MTFKGAIHEVSKNSFVRFFVPEWAMGMTAYTRKIRLASEELDVSSFAFFCLHRLADDDLRGICWN